MGNLFSFTTKIPAWLITGVLFGLSWPNYPVETGWLAWFALVPLLLRVRRVGSFREHVRVTLPAFLLLPPLVCWWLSYFSPWAVPVIWVSQVPFLWLPVALFYPLQKHLGWRQALLLLPLLWTVWEWAWLYLSDVNMAVGNPAYTQARLLFLNQFVDLTGQWGLLCWVLGMNVLIARLCDASATWSRTKQVGRLALGVGGWLAAPVLYSAVVLNVPALVVDRKATPVRVGLVQTNEDSYAAHTDSSDTAVLQRLVRLSIKAVSTTPGRTPGRPDMVIAPEGAFPLPLMHDSILFAGLRQYVQYWNVPFATGLMTPIDSTHFYNEAFVFTPELSRVYEPLHLTPADLKVYRKQHIMVFAEDTPWLLRWANRWIRGGKPAVTVGDQPYAFRFADQQKNPRTVAMSICWEQLYPNTIAALTREGPADLLAFIMNDGWFYDSPGPGMLLTFTQLRAIENRRSVARCSNQGYSGYVDPFGRVVSVLPRRQEAVGHILVQTNTRLTFFTRHPNWFPITCGLVLAGWLMLWNRAAKKSQQPLVRKKLVTS
ncbi:apolipoprotein N-acyltransferase [Fibrella arboris]|uniref:apolipoprotein N-acyltransferase n=1 Tax=Fibrella arboris TaxID=3242486 RepID=UPI0035227965